MGVLTAAMRTSVGEQRLGFVATVDEAGRPCVSPKATFVIVDDDTLAFGEIRSPNTLANIARHPEVEINFVHVLSRKGFRCRGAARFVEKSSEGFADYQSHFDGWGSLVERINGVVVIALAEAKMVTSPAYDMGAKEADLRVEWLAKLQSQVP